MYSESAALLAKPVSRKRDAYRLAYIPHENMGNAYTDRMRELMTDFGNIERFSGIKQLLRELPHSRKRYDAIVVNWLDNAIVSSTTGRISVGGAGKLFFKTLCMKPFAKRMVFVRHNNYPHWTGARSQGIAQRLVDRYEALFDVVITHSGAAADQRKHYYYCPHPLYRLATEQPSMQQQRDRQPNPESPDDYFVAFGRIVPYKKLDALMENFPSRRKLIIAGSVGDQAYAKKLTLLQRDNVVFLPGHLTEAEAQQLVRGARGVVIANADRDVVVSGTFFYAMSLGCPVYAVTTPFLEWIRERIGDELVVLSPDLKRLCRAIAKADVRPVSTASREAVVREFGDHAVSGAIGAALGVQSGVQA